MCDEQNFVRSAALGCIKAPSGAGKTEIPVDTFVEAQCAQFYADGIGRPSLAPGRYFRLLLLGYFEGLDSERAIAWRAADSLSIRQFLDVALHEAPPDHSTLSRTRRLIDVETHQAVFTWVLQRLADAHLVEGHTIGIDATTLEANAAMRSIVRRDTGDAYEAWLTRLAAASGIATPTRAELARFDRTRKKKGSNDDWTHPGDPDAKITKMKDGRTHLAHKAGQAVDLETGAIVGVTVQDADDGDTTTMIETLITAAEQVEALLPAGAGLAEVVADKGYHSNETMVDKGTIRRRQHGNPGFMLQGDVMMKSFIGVVVMVLLSIAGAISVAGMRESEQSGQSTFTKADYPRWIEELSNWGRWGDTDEIGAMNLVTPEKLKEAASLVKSGVSVSLAQLLGPNIMADGRRSPYQQTRRFPGRIRRANVDRVMDSGASRRADVAIPWERQPFRRDGPQYPQRYVL